jgi:hypothetical protein
MNKISKTPALIFFKWNATLEAFIVILMGRRNDPEDVTVGEFLDFVEDCPKEKKKMDIFPRTLSFSTEEFLRKGCNDEANRLKSIH